MKTVLIDTNFFIECVKNKIDTEQELRRILPFNFDIAIVDRTIEELETIIGRKGEAGRAAKIVKIILHAKKIKIIPTQGEHTDDILLKKSSEDIIIATMDKELKQRLKKKGRPCIIIRAKKKIEIQHI